MSSIYFIKSLTGKIYKILPMKEDELQGKIVHLKDYINSLSIEVIGAIKTFPELSNEDNYISVVNIINFMNDNEFDYKICKREVFKMLNFLNLIEDRLAVQDGKF